MASAPVAFPSYPYEWCFSQLRDAALLTLEFQERAVSRGLSLRSASAFQVQFQGPRPVFPHEPELVREGRGWGAYYEFCRQFVAPLLLMKHMEPAGNQCFRSTREGLPLNVSAQLLGWKTLWRPRPFFHVHLNSWMTRALGPWRWLQNLPGPQLIDSLRRTILDIAPPVSLASEFDTEHFSASARRSRREFVLTIVERYRPSMTFDLGSCAEALSEKSGLCVAFDSKPHAVEAAYNRAKARNSSRFLPLLIDFCDPTPSFNRPKADLVIAPGAASRFRMEREFALTRVAGFLARMGKLVITEYTPDLSFDRFLDALAPFFRLREQSPIPGTPRTIVLLERVA